MRRVRVRKMQLHQSRRPRANQHKEACERDTVSFVGGSVGEDVMEPEPGSTVD